MSEDKSFLSRWSERKRQVAVEELETKPSAPEEVPADPFEGKTDEEILLELALPEPESLKLGDRVEAFMSPEVPERIRARALRAFWRTNPILANVDGLDDYCDDFTDAAFAVENIQTIYEVGKGYAQQALDALEKLADAETPLPEDVTGQIEAPQDAEADAKEPDLVALESIPETARQDADQDVQADVAMRESSSSQGALITTNENGSQPLSSLASRRMRFQVS